MKADFYFFVFLPMAALKLSIDTDLLPSERTFHDLYVAAVERGGNFSDSVDVRSLRSVLDDPTVPMDLACVITMICERVDSRLRGEVEPSKEYRSASDALVRLGKGRDGSRGDESRVISNIRARYARLLLEEQEGLHSAALNRQDAMAAA
jgi:hypothetical protein